jgi:pyruvate dehydrogenase E1 component alpha subunit
MDLDSKKMIELYQIMLRIRRFEEKVVDLYARQLIPGMVHLYIGQAVAAGVCVSWAKMITLLPPIEAMVIALQGE